MSCGVGRRHGMDPVLLWYRTAAADPIQPLAWESPYALGAAIKRRKKKKKKKKAGVFEIIVLGVPIVAQVKDSNLSL